MLNLLQVAQEVSNRLIGLFTSGSDGTRSVNSGRALSDNSPCWSGCVKFFEYFHEDTGTRPGTSNHTGWTAFVANLVGRQG
jgi:hypothetical protein